EELAVRTRKAIAPGGNANEFVERLAREKQRRHDRFGDSLYLLEPSLKHGIGALRDLATAVWAARARWSVDDLRSLVGMGHMSSRQVAILESARDFFLRIRSLVQLAAGRRTDQLTFEIQEAIAPRLYPSARPPEGDIRPAVAPAVEALMRHYYLHARGVVGVNERLLEAVLVPSRRRPRIVRLDGSFVTFNGKLSLTDPQVIRDRPAEMLRVFRVALAEKLPVYGHTKELIADAVATSGTALTGDPEAGRLFLEALCDVRDSAQPSLLEEAHQLGLLNAVMPEFAPCTCRVQHDLYHVYTVDQHQLYAVAMLKRLARGELAAALPVATEAYRGLGQVAPLYLGTLLHDVGKPLGKGHAEKGARLADTIARRLGMGDADAGRVEFLVRQHLTMSHLSQRRDLGDAEVIERFAERVGDEETLTQLYLLTVCDAAMTSPENLNAWKEQLLRELYLRTRDHLRGAAGRERAADRAVAEARARAVDLMVRGGEDEGAARRVVDSIDQRLFTTLTPRQAARHAGLALRLERSGAPFEIEVACYPLKGHSELAIAAADLPGLLSAIAGTLSANRIDVLEAMVGCRSDSGGASSALDLFYVRDLVGRAIDADDARWERLRGDLTGLVAGGKVDPAAVADLLARRRQKSFLDRRVTPAVATEIRIDNQDSADYTVVEVFTRDRVGVLYAITHALAELDLDIHLAKISTEGEKVADVFYVRHAASGAKITEADELKKVTARISQALEAIQDD
ncbi:MAG TPA: ACT domain-containing protein, partial [Kofleriaceae bacterium]|nr:ACT domain-containing protein [Kofleriaceae bacterium]